jgi:hypothetical protein
MGELTIIVIGVLIALWVESWRQANEDRALEREYVERLVEDLTQDSIGFADMLAHVPRTNAAAHLLRDLVRDPSAVPTDTTAFVAALEEARSIQNNPWSDGTYAELLATGNMSVLRSGELKSALNVYYVALEGLYTWVERRVDRTFRDRSAALLPPEVREGIYLRHFWSWDAGRNLPSDEWLEEAATSIDVDTALRDLRSIDDVELLLGRVIDLTSGHVEYLEHAAGQQVDILSQLRAQLPD